MIESLIKESIKKFTPYSSARNLNKSGILLDANENPFDNGLNRYPDPEYLRLREAIAGYVGVSAENIFVSSGSDEILSLLGKLVLDDNSMTIACSPTYGMYKVVTESYGANFVDVPLKKGTFQINLGALSREMSPSLKIIFLCSPNNPTGNLLNREDILNVLDSSRCLVVVDEAYIEFSSAKSLSGEVKNYPNLVVLRTFSKAWGLAGARVGYCVANREIVDYLNKIKLPYNLNVLSERVALSALSEQEVMSRNVKEIVNERERLKFELETLGLSVFSSEANFLFVRFDGADELVGKMIKKFNIVIRAFPQGFRVSVGLPEDNTFLINCLKKVV